MSVLVKGVAAFGAFFLITMLFLSSLLIQSLSKEIQNENMANN